MVLADVDPGPHSFGRLYAFSSDASRLQICQTEGHPIFATFLGCRARQTSGTDDLAFGSLIML